MECIELNWLCKHIKKIWSSQPAIPVLNWVKHQSFPESIVKNVNPHTSYFFVYTYRSIRPLVLFWKITGNSFFSIRLELTSTIIRVLQANRLTKCAGGFSFLIKLQSPAHVFYCEFCEIKNIYFVEKLRMAASEHRFYIFFFVLILRQNRYLPLNSDPLLDKQRAMLWYRSQPSKMSYLWFGDFFNFLPFHDCLAIILCSWGFGGTEPTNGVMAEPGENFTF